MATPARQLSASARVRIATLAACLAASAIGCTGSVGAPGAEPSEPAADVAVLEVPLESTDAAGRTFRLTGMLTLDGPEQLDMPLLLDDALAGEPTLTLTPRTGSYIITLNDWEIHEWDDQSGSFVPRADATPTSELTQGIEIRMGEVSVARFAFHVPIPSGCAIDNGGCDPLTLCNDSSGSVVCEECPVGYSGDGVTGCLDLNECDLGLDTCTSSAFCYNYPGGFGCQCPDGWLDVYGDATVCHHIRDISTGTNRACAINELGALYCWGENGSRQLGDGTTTSRPAPFRIGSASDWQRIAVGENATCGLKGAGELWCWGGNFSGHGASQNTPARIGSDSDWTFVASYSTNTCAIRGAGALYCWGNNGNGQVGIGSTTPSTIGVPTRVGSLEGWVDVAMGNSGTTCGVRSNGELYCWGYNGGYNLGDGTNVDKSSPTLIGTGGWSTVALGQLNGCGVKNGELYCWGADGYGVLGDGTAGGPTATVPQRVGSANNWNALAMGHYHVCGLRGGERWCWGYGGMGQLGNGAALSSATPLRGDTSTAWTRISANLQLNCGVREGEPWCWGENTYGTLGNGVGPTQVAPKLINFDPGWTQLSAGLRFNCGVRAGELWCWGDGTSGKLGTGNTASRPYPARVGTTSGWSYVSTANSHACGIRSGALYCWGSGGSGQLGDGANVIRTSPVVVLSPFGVVPNGWTHVTTGVSHTCGINNGALYCWGSNTSGQRGDANTMLAVNTPLRIGFDADWTTVDANSDNTCALRGDQLYCWGSQVAGVQYTITPLQIPGSWSAISAGTTLCGLQSGALHCWGSAYLGNGTASNSGTPVRIGTDSDWQSVTTGNSYACGRRSAGLYCWGGNNVGQLGDDSMLLRVSPSLTSSASDWTSVEAANGAHVCGLRSGIGVLCWGSDQFSELGDGYAVINPTPWFAVVP